MSLSEVNRYLTKSEADVAAALLVNCGIAAQVFADNEGHMVPYLSIITGARLMVPTEQLRQAREVLASEVPVEGDETRPVGEDADPGLALVKDVHRVYVASIFGTLILPLISQAYALWIAIPLWARWGEMGRRTRVKFFLSIVVDVGLLTWVAWFAFRIGFGR